VGQAILQTAARSGPSTIDRSYRRRSDGDVTPGGVVAATGACAAISVTDSEGASGSGELTINDSESRPLHPHL